jgi:hypothetical protein
MIAGRLVGAEVVRLPAIAAIAAVSGRGVSAMAAVSGRGVSARTLAGPAQQTAGPDRRRRAYTPATPATSSPGAYGPQQKALVGLPLGLGLRPKNDPHWGRLYLQPKCCWLKCCVVTAGDVRGLGRGARA